MAPKKKTLPISENCVKLQIEMGNLSIKNDEDQLSTHNTKTMLAEQSEIAEQLPVGKTLKTKASEVGIQTIEDGWTKNCAKCTRTCEHHAKTKENLKEKIIVIRALKKEMEMLKKENEKLINDDVEHVETAQGFERALEVIRNREETINHLNRRLEAFGEKQCLKEQVEIDTERVNGLLKKKCEKCFENNKNYEEAQQELKKKEFNIKALKKELDLVKTENKKLINDGNCKVESEHFGRVLTLIKEKGDTINHLYQRLDEEGSKSRDQMYSLRKRIEELEQSLTSTKILNKNLEKETHEAKEANHVCLIYYKKIKALEVYLPPEVERKNKKYEQELEKLRKELLWFDSEYSVKKYVEIKKEVQAMDDADERKNLALSELQAYSDGLNTCCAVYQRNFTHLKEQRSLDELEKVPPMPVFSTYFSSIVNRLKKKSGSGYRRVQYGETSGNSQYQQHNSYQQGDDCCVCLYKILETERKYRCTKCQKYFHPLCGNGTNEWNAICSKCTESSSKQDGYSLF
ncbi:hypothetical protein GCK72_024940 [Caenorhabditis remanei]|uniref:Uncharacterized protein n=1 Tax=Caenorhabditis remanei TaxID=31234 RepID=A0A6A5G0Z6_CAERE|nr:hypothetical protein GCK72_024940 [Caenorhabditis remanei]KAF1748473.1 hypothetical protein GCK72_024940 [Caenorhabditis remanei]